MAAAAASLLGLGQTVQPPPVTPGAAAAFELLQPLAKTAPAAPGLPGDRDDQLLEKIISKLVRKKKVWKHNWSLGATGPVFFLGTFLQV